MINEPGRCPTRSENVYFGNNELEHRLQPLLLCFVLHMPSIIYMNYIIIDQRKLLTVFWSVLCEIQRNQSNLLTFKN